MVQRRRAPSSSGYSKPHIDDNGVLHPQSPDNADSRMTRSHSVVQLAGKYFFYVMILFSLCQPFPTTLMVATPDDNDDDTSPG